MLNKNLRKNMMESMDKIDMAAEKIEELTNNITEDHIFKAQIAGQLATIYSSLKEINNVLLTDVLTSRTNKEQV